MSETGPRKMSWWRIGLGGLLLVLGLKNLDPRNIPAELLPSNNFQWFGFYLASAVFVGTGLFLIVAGLKRVRRRPTT